MLYVALEYLLFCVCLTMKQEGILIFLCWNIESFFLLNRIYWSFCSQLNTIVIQNFSEVEKKKKKGVEVCYLVNHWFVLHYLSLRNKPKQSL